MEKEESEQGKEIDIKKVVHDLDLSFLFIRLRSRIFVVISAKSMNNLKYLSKRFRIESYPLSTLKRWHSTEMMLNTVSDQDGRLRLEEENYSTKVSSPIEEPYGSVLKSLAERTAKELPNGHMMVSELQGRLLHQLVKLLRPRHVLEIGGFTGYSAIAMGSGLGHDAKLLSLELENKHIKIAQKHVEMAKLQDKIQFREGPASDR